MSRKHKTPKPVERQSAVFTVAEAAARLGVPDLQVRNLIEEGKLLAVNVGLGSRKVWRIPVNAVEGFKEPHKAANAEGGK